MKVLVLFAILAWSSWESVRGVHGNLLDVRESVNVNERAYMPPPFFPPYHPTYFNPRPECFSQPPIPEVKIESVVCEPCAAPQACTCEPILPTCQTYSITVCPPSVETFQSSQTVEEVVESIVEQKLEEELDVHVRLDSEQVVEAIPEYPSPVFSPLTIPTIPYPGYNQIVNGLYPHLHYGGYPRTNVQDLIKLDQISSIQSGVRSLSDAEDDDDHDDSSKKK